MDVDPDRHLTVMVLCWLLLRYVAFPETMATIVAYIRREAQRLDSVSDAKVLGPREVGREGEGVVALRWRPL